jgi:hypothetical protein
MLVVYLGIVNIDIIINTHLLFFVGGGIMSDNENSEGEELDLPTPYVEPTDVVEYRSNMCQRHFTLNLEDDILNRGLPLSILAQHLNLVCSNNDGTGCTAMCEKMQVKSVLLSNVFITQFIRKHVKRITLTSDGNIDVDAVDNIIELITLLQYPIHTVLFELGVNYIVSSDKLMMFLHDYLLDPTTIVVDAHTAVFIASLGLYTPVEFASLHVDDMELADVINAFEHNHFTVNNTDVNGFIAQRRELYKDWLGTWSNKGMAVVDEILLYLPHEPRHK